MAGMDANQQTPSSPAEDTIVLSLFPPQFNSDGAPFVLNGGMPNPPHPPGQSLVKTEILILLLEVK